MFKRLVLATLFAGLTATLGAGGNAVFAEPGSATWLTDGTIQGSAWQGLPDNQNLTAKFVVLDGPSNNGLGAYASLGQSTTLTLTFDRAPEDDRVRIALFDPNTIGNWDQRVDSQLVNKAPDVVYEVFKPTAIVDGVERCTDELLFDASLANDPAPILVTSAYKDYNKVDSNGDPVNDDVWCVLADWSTAEAAAAGLQLSDGRFRVVLRARLRPAPRNIVFGQDHDPLTVPRDISSFTGRERAGYKIAFDGTYLIPAGGVVGFAGGVIDERVVCAGAPSIGCASTRDPTARIVDPTLDFATKMGSGEDYFYDGLFNFHLHSSQACRGDIEFFDADADWVDVAAIGPGDLVNGFLTGSKLTGIPPENVARYIRPNDLLCDGKRDIGGTAECPDSNRLVGDVIAWRIVGLNGFPGHNTDPFDPSATPTFDSAHDATDGHPSITAGQEPGGPFKKNLLDQTKVLGGNGLWCLQWYGVDMANFVFLRFNVPVGTTPRPSLKIDVFCDVNSNCERDDGDTAVPINDGKIALKLTEVDCDTGADVAGGNSFEVTTDVTGVWMSADCPAMLPACYRLEFVGNPPLTAGPECIDLPRIVDLRANSGTSQCVTVELPRDCTGMLSGDVYCELGTDCSYDPATDAPLPVDARLRVIATPITMMGMGTPVETEVTGPSTSWAITGLPFGEYLVSYTWITAPIALKGSCTATRNVETTPSVPSVGDIDFGFECLPGVICGDVYCEEGRDCLYDAAVDMPLPNGTRYIVVLTPVVGGSPVPAAARTISGTAPETRYCFRDLALGEYEITVIDDPTSTPVQELPPLSSSCKDTKSVTLTENTPEVDDCDFGYECRVKICGDVYCEHTGDCLYDDGVVDGRLPAGTVVEVTLRDAAGAPTTLTVTAPETRFCFTELPYGTYTLSYAFAAGSPTLDLAPNCQDEKSVTVSVVTGSVDDCDFGFVCLGSVCGNVYCEDTGNCLLDAGTPDGPLPAGSQAVVTLTPIVGGQPDVANVQTRTVTGPATDYCFLDLPLAEYELTVALLPGGPTLELAPACDDLKSVTLTAAKPDVGPCDFGYICKATIKGVVFCDENLDERYSVPPDMAPVSATVQAQFIPVAGPLPAPLTTNVGVDGTFVFDPVAPGKYVLKVTAIDPASWEPLFDNVNGIEVTVPAGETREVLLPYDCRTCEIHGTVYCDDDLSGTLTLGDLRFEGVEVTASGPAATVLKVKTNAAGEYAFLDLEPGVWVITVDPDQAPYNTVPPRPTAPQPEKYTLDCGRGDMVMDIDFRSLCLGRIYGYVFQDPLGDCDGVYQEGTDTPVDGARIRLTGPGILPAPNPREATTNADGYYQFGDLPRGIYKVEILDPLLDKWVVLGLASSTPRVVEVDLPRLGEKRVDFGFCVQKLVGVVFQDNPSQDCDGVYQEGVDIPVDGARVRLTGPAGLPAPNPREAVTDANGRYEFPNLVPGDYTVEILFPLPAKWEALKLTLVAGITPAVQPVSLPVAEIKRIDFAFCVQSLCGKVFKQPYGDCDGVWNPDRDTGLAGVLVELTGTAGDALGYSDSTRTDANGDYCFNNVPTGMYEIRLSETDAQTIAILSLLIDDGVKVLTPTVDVGQRIHDLDFPKCECEQRLCVNVFREEAPACDGVYDQGIDKLAEFIQVRFEQISTGRSTVLMTDADGRICLPIVQSGDYRVSIDPNQQTLVDCRPSPDTVLERVVSFDPKECADQDLWFGFCCCTKLGCCEGKLHEVVMETRFWQCPGPHALEASAAMYMDCGGDDLVDEATASLVGGDFGSTPGIGGVVKIESISWVGPIVTVRVRFTAAGTRFPTGSFGNDKHLVTVSLNGDTSRFCDVFRAEILRPGAIPGCAVWDEELCAWIPVEWPCEPGVSHREVDWNAYSCENLCWSFGVVEIWCFKDWCRCNCTCPPECKPCTGNVTAMTLRYDGDKTIWTVLIQSHDGRLLFEGEVKPGDVLPLEAKGDDGTMGPEVKLFTNEVCTPIKTNCEDAIGIGTQIGPFTVVAGASSEGGPFCDPSRDANGRLIPERCSECCVPEKPCDCIAGVTHLAFRYTGEEAKWVVLLQSFDGRLLFEGMVRPGGVIRVEAQGDDGTMGSTIKLLTNEFCGELDVTCRSPIGIGTTSGPFVVIAGASRDGGRFCGSVPDDR